MQTNMDVGSLFYILAIFFVATYASNITQSSCDGYMCHGAESHCIPTGQVCDGDTQCPAGDDEFFCSVDYTHPCRGRPRVCPDDPASCVDPDRICDGLIDCPYGADEVACNVTSCPLNCECHYLSVRCKYVEWNETQAEHIQLDTRKLWIQKPHDQVIDVTNDTEMSAVIHANISEYIDLNILTIRSFPFTYIKPGTFTSLRFLNFLDLMMNEISYLGAGMFHGLSSLEQMYLLNNNIETIETGAFEGLESLNLLLMNDNAIGRLEPGMFDGLENLGILALVNNVIESVEADTFLHMSRLHYLSLESNAISSLESDAFAGLVGLRSLHLGNNRIASIKNSTFISLTGLEYLDLHMNPLVLLEPNAFLGLDLLQTLIISEAQLMSVEMEAANGLHNLLELTADDPKLCCLFTPTNECNTQPNPFATCEGMLRTTFLRVCIWLLGFSALIGNLLVIATRTYRRNLHDRENTVQMTLITNLAVADLLMGIYMLFIASTDAHFGADYFLHSTTWRNSSSCKLAGFIAMLASEASVFLLVLITLDRFICIVFPFGFFRFRTRSTRIAIALAWFWAILLSVVPIIVSNHASGFYGYSDVCIGLPLVTPATGFQGVWEASGDGETQVFSFIATGRSGWAYSTAIFIVLNLICFLVIFVCYIAIFKSARKASVSAGRKTELRDEIKMAAKMAVIVGTDFCCWVPIIVMGIVSQSGAAVIPVETYVWTIIFILPINSSLNPYLYTISTMVQQKLSDKSGKKSSSSHRLSASTQRTSLSGGYSNSVASPTIVA